ncbi:MAG TPA: hypothetical protein VGM87_21950 [Roseomonas sp.]
MSLAMKEDLGITNKGWGVCGFTSTFYAMWAQNPGSRGALMNAPKPFTVLAEIKTYLMLLLATGKTAELKSITDFTRSFGAPYDAFTIDSYVARINDAVDLTDEQIVGNKLFGIAMPPTCVADYAKRIWGYDCAITTGDAGGNAIIGVQSSAYPTMTAYRGLCHYMYRYNNRIYSWGKSFGSVAEANSKYTVVWTLRLDK